MAVSQVQSCCVAPNASTSHPNMTGKYLVSVQYVSMFQSPILETQTLATVNQVSICFFLVIPLEVASGDAGGRFGNS